MHEVSVCQTLISTLEEEFSRDDLSRVREVHLKAGVLSCVEPEFIRRVFEMMTPESSLKNARLVVQQVPVVAHCTSCGCDFPVRMQLFICPHCNIPSSSIVSGNELEVYKVLLDESSYEET